MRKHVALLLLLGFSGAVSACSCARMTGSARYAEATVVFHGKVVAASVTENPGLSEFLGSEIVRAKIAPIEIFKGAGAPSFEVTGGTDFRNPVCNLPLVAGVEYVFALGPDMQVSSCNSWAAGAPDKEESVKTFRRLKAQTK